jgi:UDP-N-acetylglucosamine--N-acetylmuramyl-(pentapeptide) pyrophosphoryl-undecaprenol N-acetylglucosamine transferase
VIHLAGVDEEEEMRLLYTQAGVPHVVHSFTHDMGSVYRASDLAVCRSGASTCAELLAYGVPALLVPYPYAAKDHQVANARALEKAGAADVVPERDLSVDWLSDYLVECLHTPGRLARMSAASRKRARPNGAASLADLVERVAREAVKGEG